MNVPVHVAVPAETARQQSRASDPAASAWVTANAGSGKTTVLVRRVLRLMLADVDPCRILCLTYTTAAAANMQNRLFETLSEWARAPEAELDARLAPVLDRAPASAERARARTLFAEALETPGGLQIQTIHAFCTRVLQSAPFEAGIPAYFEVISETDRIAAIEAAVGRALNRASEDGPALKRSLDRIAREVDDQRFRDLIDKALEASDFLMAGGVIRSREDIEADLAAALGVEPSASADRIVEAGLGRLGRVLDIARAQAAVMAHGTEPERRRWEPHAEALRSGPAEARLAVWRSVLLTEKGTPRANPVSKGVQAREPWLLPACEAALDILLDLLETLNALAIYERSAALFALARLILDDYARTKRRMAALDYDDLIAHARALFESVDAGWLLYKLDAGLDHLLVDEAQDTSADQWAILNALTSEFLAGKGARSPKLPRTIFAVGDEKQSIFGFQGAAPAEFGQQRAALQRRFPSDGDSFRDVRLQVSFRSTPDVIAAVDAVFAQPQAFKGLSSASDEVGTVHATVRAGASGAVDLWDLIEPDPGDEEVVWKRPLDAPERQAPVQRLADAIARTLRGWMRAGQDDLGQPFDPGEVLILLPRRKAAFAAIVKALKSVGVPVAGVDRIRLSSHIAVEDLIALGRAALLPADDLTLAVVLKSPIFGLGDDDLLRIAAGREGSLRQALAASGHPVDRQAEERWSRIEAMATALGPFAFYTTVLSVMGGRKAMLARLGAEASDAIDVFLLQALAHEQREGPSLTCFLSAVEASSDDVKRDLGTASGEVRVMTVHGAKGLEARTVIIADIGPPPGGRGDPPLMDLPLPSQLGGRSVAVWAGPAATDCSALAKARDEGRGKAAEEHHRLLYVAMTRAADRLIVCGVRPASEKTLAASWYGLIESGLQASEAGLRDIEPAVEGIGRRRFKITPDRPAALRADAPGQAGAPVSPQPEPMPEWVQAPLTAETSVRPPLTPASALAASGRPDRPGDEAALAAAADRGRFVHLLLQWLPAAEPDVRTALAMRGAARFLPAMDEAARAGLVAQTLAVMAAPDLAPLFGPGSVAEVEVGGRIGLPGRERGVSGRIDRLMIGEDLILFADFKTASRPPAHEGAIPADTLAQLAAYRALLSNLYPGRPVRALAVYTAGPVVLEPSAARLDAALAAILGG